MEISNFNRIQELQIKRAENLSKMDDLVSHANADNVIVNEEIWQRYLDEGNALDKRIDQLETIERQKSESAAKEIERREAQKKAGNYKADEDRNLPGDPKEEYRFVFNKYLRNGMENLTNEERKLMGQYQARGTGNQTTTTTAGGFTIPEGFSDMLEVQLKSWGAVRNAASIITTETGNLIPWPTVNDTAVVGALLSEGTADTVSDMTFAEKELNAYTYSSNTVKVSIQLMQDSAFDLAAFLAEALAVRLGRITNTHFTTGDNSSKPNGYVTAASTGKTAASATAITRAELVDLVHSVDPAYRVGPKVGFMFNDATFAYIKKLAFGASDDRPLWQPSVIVGAPSTLEGFQYWINQDQASIATTAKSVSFGDFSKYVIRDAGGVTMLRLNERYMDALLVGFMGYLRTDGELIQTAAIKNLVQA